MLCVLGKDKRECCCWRWFLPTSSSFAMVMPMAIISLQASGLFFGKVVDGRCSFLKVLECVIWMGRRVPQGWAVAFIHES